MNSRQDDKGNKILVREISTRISLENDNSRLLALLATICGKDTSKLETTVRKYGETLKEASWEAGKRIKALFAERYHIYGSAFCPNIEDAPGWAEITDEIKKKYIKMLKAETENLT